MEHPAGYARKTLVNETTSWWRRRSSREQVLMLDHDLPVAATDDVALTHQMAWQAVLRLPPRQRAVIVLRYYEDLSEAETAQILDIAVGTVKSHCHSAVAQLGRILGEPTELNSGGIS
jgi:RNA polymerase sigma factor (sigma-70 family)